MRSGPLAIQFADKLKRLIASEVYKVGNPLPSVERLHLHHGISKNTILASLKILSEEGLIQRGDASRHGYMVVKKPENMTEVSVEARESIVKINMPFSSWNSVPNKLLEALESVFTSYGFRLIFSNNNNSTQEETQFLQTLLSRDDQIASALILMTGNSFHNPNVRILNHLHAQLPIIFLDRYIPNVRSHYVGADNHDIGFQATQYLLARGYARIGFVSHSSQLSTTNDRFNGYITALTQADIQPDFHYIIRKRTDHVDLEYIKSLGQELGEEILALKQKPNAWVCGSDKEAVGLIDFFSKQGYVIPGDMAFVGCDNDEFLLHDKEYTLTTFEYPYAEIANEIHQLSDALVKDPELPYKKVEFAAKFIEGTTA